MHGDAFYLYVLYLHASMQSVDVKRWQLFLISLKLGVGLLEK